MSISSSNSDPVTEFPIVPAVSAPSVSDDESSCLFQQCLLDNLRDGIIFVDAQFRILVWSQTIEVMTGMSSSKVDGLQLTPQLLGMSDQDGVPFQDTANPLIEVIATGKKKHGDYRLVGRSGRELKVGISFTPVLDARKVAQGAVILVHDSSVQLDLQRQLQDLYEFSMLDPLTQVANRAEFEKALEESVRARNVSDFQCSLIVCDIDFFKQVNDNYNHHIGDQALVSFAGLLKKFVRSQDVVARYGGEEFVILCANCDIDSAVQRAEEIRVTLTKTPQQMLDGKCITASFGVSELQPGDCATDFFVRADTALLRAKELGRNRVVEANSQELGAPPQMKSAEITSLAGVSWRKLKGQTLSNEEYTTTTPMAVLVEKLRGYIVEMEAEIRRVECDFASLIVEAEDEDNFSRKARFIVDIEFQEREAEGENQSFGRRNKTFIRITVREGKRSWFAANAIELAPQVVTEIRRYFMINDDASKLTVAPVATEPAQR
jgi:diguanylate cyclase (GGDEF)-like protein